MKNPILIIVILASAIAVLVFVFRPDKPQVNLDEFAQCLAEKKVTMYGAYWCSHCQNEKDAFGDSFRFVPYVECTEETQKCIDAGIRGYPTWIFPDPSTGSGQAGRKLEGEQGIENLSRESGCPVGN